MLSDGVSVAYGSNRGAGPKLLERGVYAVSNAVLDTPWHKVEYAKSAFGELLANGTPDDATFVSYNTAAGSCNTAAGTRSFSNGTGFCGTSGWR